VIKVISSPISRDELKELAKEIDGYFIKLVVDLDKNIIAAGAKMHFDEEQELLRLGSSQQSLWGGGYDLESNTVTYDSIINNRPGINSGSEIIDVKIRSNVEKIIRKYLPI